MVQRRSGPRHNRLLAEVAELADAHGSGPCTRKGVGVRVPSSAPILLSVAQHQLRDIVFSQLLIGCLGKVHVSTQFPISWYQTAFEDSAS